MDAGSPKRAGAPPRKPGGRLLASTFLGTGLSPIAPGTCASMAAAGLLLLPLPDFAWTAMTLAGVLLFTAASLPLARWAERVSGTADPSWFVLDEAAGMFLAALAPGRPGPESILVALVAFRLFDIIKPPPIRRLEGIPGGPGVVLDDLAAGAMALLLRLAVERLFL